MTTIKQIRHHVAATFRQASATSRQTSATFRQTSATFRLAALAALLFLAACRKEATQPATTPAQPDNDMVITPAGLMHRSNVHFVAPGSQLSVIKGRLLRVDSKSGKSLEDFGEVKITPTRIAAAVQGWIAYTYWSNPSTSNPITNFTTTWTVPSVPSRQGSQTIFLFNGMQDGTTSSSYIVQPVLQWGPSAAGGGKYWAITELRRSCFATLLLARNLRSARLGTSPAARPFSAVSSRSAPAPVLPAS